MITGVLLREQGSTERISILGFYGRRARRILPAATFVIIAATVASFGLLGVIYGNQTARDARWVSVFLANFHFASTGTNYFTAAQPPSPLQNFWSLAVEEQFYLVYPTIFLVLVSLRSWIPVTTRLAFALGAGIVISFVLSVGQTTTNMTAAYFSPFTRAWELALGALIAVGTGRLLKVPRHLGPVMSWTGLAVIGLSAVAFRSSTPYPGSAVSLPVVGAVLVIAGGVVAPAGGAEALLRMPPLQWTGKLSYSLYLWHWPILVFAADAAGKIALPFSQNLKWLALAFVASVGTYLLLENPVRHARMFSSRRWPPVLMGLAAIACTLAVATAELQAHAGPESLIHPAESGTIAQLVAAAPGIRMLPSDLDPSLGLAPNDWGGPPPSCWPSLVQTSLPACVFGDRNGTQTMALVGDSHAGMWFSALDQIATKVHWRLVFVGKSSCPAALLAVQNPPGLGPQGGRYVQCDQFHQFAIDRINQIHPDLVVVSQTYHLDAHGKPYTPEQWERCLLDPFGRLDVPRSAIVILGNVPEVPSGPTCLSQHPRQVQQCSRAPQGFAISCNDAEQEAASSSGGRPIGMKGRCSPGLSTWSV